jgi:hypothetical protein
MFRLFSEPTCARRWPPASIREEIDARLTEDRAFAEALGARTPSLRDQKPRSPGGEAQVSHRARYRTRSWAACGAHGRRQASRLVRSRTLPHASGHSVRADCHAPVARFAQTDSAR